MEKFSDPEANLIISGLNVIVKEHGLERPDIYQMAYGIMIKLKETNETPAPAADIPKPHTPG